MLVSESPVTAMKGIYVFYALFAQQIHISSVSVDDQRVGKLVGQLVALVSVLLYELDVVLFMKALWLVLMPTRLPPKYGQVFNVQGFLFVQCRDLTDALGVTDEVSVVVGTENMEFPVGMMVLFLCKMATVVKVFSGYRLAISVTVLPER